MHEIALVEETLRIITGVAETHQLRRITRVNVKIGAFLQVQPELFEFAFDAAKTGTILAEASLYMDVLPARLRCRECGKESLWDKTSFTCPYCGSLQMDILDGRDIFIQSIEGE